MTLLKPTRRDVMKLAAMASALALPASTARADIGGPAAQQPTFHRFSIGSAKITVVSDGYLDLAVSGLGVNADPAEVQAYLASYFLSTTQNYSHTNHVVIETETAKVLIDVGSGSRFLNTAGRLMTNLAAAGIDPDSITHVIITHAHPDHVWGIRDDFDEAILPNAEFIIGAQEYAWWMAEGRVNQVPEDLQQFVVGAVNSLGADGLEWTMAQDGHEVAPGVHMVFTPGHTLGHMSVLVESDGQQLMLLGDAMNHAYINFDHPEWVSGFDQDKDLTVATRRKLLDRAATDRIAVLAYHFPFPGVGHVRLDKGSYRFVPALWRWQG